MTQRDFNSYVKLRACDHEINDLAWHLVEAHKMGIDVEPYIEGLGTMVGKGVDWATGKMAGLAGSGAKGLGKAVGRMGNAAISGLGGGVMRGAQRAGRALMHGQGANNASFQLKDAIGLINNAIQAAGKLQGGERLSSSLQQVQQQLQQSMNAAANLEKGGTGTEMQGISAPTGSAMDQVAHGANPMYPPGAGGNDPVAPASPTMPSAGGHALSRSRRAAGMA
jgi:hypothetical protein